VILADATIFAVAAGGAGAALTVLRLSGPGSGSILDQICGGRPAPRRASLRGLRDRDGDVLDRGLVLWFPAPGSYTGEDSAELHLHGGRAVLQAVAAALVLAGARPAEPGEFTRRAFLNGRMDLTQAEGVADLVAAETESQRRQALRQMRGALGGLYRGWTDRLIRLNAFYEAWIDFGEEDGTPDGDEAALRDIATLRAEILAHLDDNRRGQRVREGLVFAIVGAPNVGKSSLINALASRDVAIVSDRPGTTRDVLEARLELGGVAVTLLDTAGLRATEDAVEAEGIRRARARAAEADLVVAVHDPWTPPEYDVDPRDARCLVVCNKIDVAVRRSQDRINVSALTGEGIPRLRDKLCDAARMLTGGGGDAPLTRARHRAALHAVVDSLGDALAASMTELRAEDVRLALGAMGRITGRTGIEEILDSVFAQFCIGK